jgi:hypothetical protein
MLESFLQLEKSLTQHLQFARAFGLKLQFLTLNAQLRAAALQERGLQVVAGQMSFTAGLLGKCADELTRTIAGVMQSLKHAAYEIAACNLSMEMMSCFLAELSDQELCNPDSPIRRHIAHLASVVAQRFDATAKVLHKTAADLRQFEIGLHNFSRQVRTLDILHVTGRIESVNATEGGGFTGVLQDLLSMTAQARAHLADITRLVEKVEFTAVGDSATERNLSLLAAAP